MNTEDIIRYFANYRPVQVEWIDDSCCNIVFESFLDALYAFQSVSSCLSEENGPTISHPKHLRTWRKGVPYRLHVNEYFLLRFAIDTDCKPAGARQPSKAKFKNMQKNPTVQNSNYAKRKHASLSKSKKRSKTQHGEILSVDQQEMAIDR